MKKRFIEMLALFTGMVLMVPAIIVYPFVYILSGISTIGIVANMLEGKFKV
jgi:hypothetical protein